MSFLTKVKNWWHGENKAQNAKIIAIYALIPAGGVGLRSGMSMPKQYSYFHGKPMLWYVIRAFNQVPAIKNTVVVIAPHDACFVEKEYQDCQFLCLRHGGETRRETVLNGLNELLNQGAKDTDWVLVHDAARPGITPAMVGKLIDHLRPQIEDPRSWIAELNTRNSAYKPQLGGLLAIPVPDTLKRASTVQIDTDTHVITTESREGLWLAQTPQLFPIGVLRQALEYSMTLSADKITDESSAIEALGFLPKIVEGDLRNFKVTFPGDFALADRILNEVK